MPSATSAQQASSTAITTEARALPPYQVPLHPLSQKSLDKLAHLRADEFPVRSFLEKYKDAISALGQDGGDISERLVERRQLITRNQTRRQRDGKEDANLDADEAAELADLEQKVTRMTQRMEDAVRRAIDGQVAVEQLQAAHTETARDGNVNSSSTQQNSLQSQAEQTQVTIEGATPVPSQLPTPLPKELLPLFEERLEAAQDCYQAKLLYQRYAQHNEYIGFKRIIHAASFPEEQAPPLPHASTWFADAEPQPGVTATAREDDDLVVSRAHISTKCPLTLREFDDPLTSKKCPHSFEKVAILDMIKAQRPPTRRAGERDAGWRQQTQCPVPGCSEMLGKDDLERDEVLVRRIKRIQRAKELEEEEAAAGTGGHGDADRSMVDEIDSDSGDDVDAVTGSQTVVSVKGERMSQARTGNDDIDDNEYDE